MTKLHEANDDSLLQHYLKLRDRRAQRKAAFEQDDVEDKSRQIKIETEFLRRFNERGVDSVSARGSGTAYRSTRVSASVADWDIFLNHVIENQAYELLERRVNKTATQQHRDENNDLPPGVNWSETQVINFRRK